MNRPTARTAATWVSGTLLAVHAVLAWLARAPGIETNGDDAKYLLLGRSLRELHYRELWTPGTPPHAQYPPLFPSVLGALGAIVGDRFDLLILFNIAASTAALGLAWYATRHLASDAIALCVLVALAFNSLLVGGAGLLLSEPLFMALVTAAVVLLATPEPTGRRLAAAGAVALAAAMTRSTGLPLVAAVLAVWLLQRAWKGAAGYAVVSAGVLGLWFLWTGHAARALPDTYVADAAATMRVVTAAPVSYLGEVAQRATQYTAVSIPVAMQAPTIPGTTWDNALVLGLVWLGLAAGLVRLWRTWPALCLALPFSFGLLFLWPIVQTRFMLPLLPLLLALVLIGLGAVAGMRDARWGVAVAATVALALAARGAYLTIPIVQERARCIRGSTPPDPSCELPEHASFFAAARFIAGQVPEDAILINAKPAPLYFYSGRRALVTSSVMAGDSAGLADRLRRSRVGWILLSSQNNSEIEASRRLRAVCNRLVPVLEFEPRTWLFRLADQPSADSSGCRALDDYRRDNFGRDFNRDR